MFHRSAGRSAAGLSGTSGRRFLYQLTQALRYRSSFTLGRQVITSKHQNNSFVVPKENDRSKRRLIHCQMTKAARWIKTFLTPSSSTRRASDTAMLWRTIRLLKRCHTEEMWPWSCAPFPTRSVKIHRNLSNSGKQSRKVQFASTVQLRNQYL